MRESTLKTQLRRLFAPILKPFESGNEPFNYKASHRIVLRIMSILFIGLATIVCWLAQGEDPGYLLPVILFGGTGILGLIIGFLGQDRAVAKIWGSRH